MKRKTVLLHCILAAALLAFLLPGLGAAADKPTKLVFQNNYTTGHARMGEKCFGRWFTNVQKRAGKILDLEVHWAGEPLPATEALDGLSKGVIDMLTAFPPYYSGKVGITDICAMPKNLRTDADVYDLWWNSPLGQLVDAAYQKRANAKVVFPIIFGPENFQLSKRSRKIRHFEDFKGLKIRAGGGMPMETVKALGGSPVHTHGGEYYTALQRGTIDGGLIPIYALESYKAWEVCDQAILPAIFGHCFSLVWMNLDKWKQLSPEIKEILVDEARKLETFWISYNNLDDMRIIKKAQQMGVEFYTLPPEDQKKMWDATETVWDLYVQNCAKQGLEQEGKQIREIVRARFEAQ